MYKPGILDTGAVVENSVCRAAGGVMLMCL